MSVPDPTHRRLMHLAAVVFAATMLVACAGGASPEPSTTEAVASGAPQASSATPADAADRIVFGRWNAEEDLAFPPAMWTANPDGSGQRPVGDHRGWYVEWSPDRSHLVFDFIDADGNAHIATVKPDGADYAQLTSGPGFFADPAYSPDGTRIAFTHSPVREDDEGFSRRLWMMDADGGNARALMSAEEAGEDWEPVFSPDGTQIVFTRDTEEGGVTVGALHVVNADGSDVRALTAFHDYVEHPQWSPDGNTIIYNIETQNPGTDAPTNGIWTVPAAGGESTLLLASTQGVHPFKPDYSPDGTQILFGCANLRAGNEDLCVMGADGEDQRVIVSTPEIENHGAW